MSKRVVVVGNGIIGVSCALAALQRGMQVTIVDRNSNGGDNCSCGNSGLIVPSHFKPLAAPGMISQGLRWMRDPESPFYVKPRLSWDLAQWGLRFYLAATQKQVDLGSIVLRDLSLASRELYLQWESEGIDASLAKRGLLMLCNTQHGLDEEAAAAVVARDLGIPASVLTPEQTSALDPNISMDIKGSVYYPKDCHLDPIKLLKSLRSRIQSLGGSFLDSTHVTGWKLNGSKSKVHALETNRGEVEADEFVLSGGVWSDELTRPLGLRISMQPGKGYSLTIPDPIEHPQLSSILVEARVAVTPIGSSLRFGGTMELGELNQSIEPRRISGIIKSVSKYFPRFDAELFANIQPWIGLRPVSPDGLPYIGRTARFQNLTIATGHAMMGVSLGPITGKLVGQVLAGESPTISLVRLSPDRYSN